MLELYDPFSLAIYASILSSSTSHMYTRSVFMNCLCVIYLSLKQSSCAFNKEDRGAEMSGSVSIKSGSESDLQAAVAYVGPVAVAVDASSRAFRVCTPPL